MIKKGVGSVLAMAFAPAHAGFGGMGSVESDGGSDITGPEHMFVVIALAIAYFVMKKTNIGQQVEIFCGTFWGMVVLTIGSLFGVGLFLRLIHELIR